MALRTKALPRGAPRYQDFVNELCKGLAHGVFIDDTGSPGLTGQGDLHPKRKSWVAVVIPSTQAPEVIEQLFQTLPELGKLVPGAREFHFTDIYAGKGAFKAVDLKARLGIFRFMSWIFDRYKFPALVQTLDPMSMKDFKMRLTLPDSLGPLRLSKHEDLSLFMLLVRLKIYLQSGSLPARMARVFVDEGRFKNGGTVVIPPFKTVFADGYISFADSRSVLPLQLADFAAFSMNRWQLLRQKENLSELDKELLAILTPVAHCFVNIDKVVVDDPSTLKSLKGLKDGPSPS